MAIAIAIAKVFFERVFMKVDGVLQWAIVVHRRHYGSMVALQGQLEAAVTGCENGKGQVVGGDQKTASTRRHEGEAGDVATISRKIEASNTR